MPDRECPTPVSTEGQFFIFPSSGRPYSSKAVAEDTAKGQAANHNEK